MVLSTGNPIFIEIDISKLEIGNSINLDSLRSDKYEVMLKENPIVCTILAPRVRKTEESAGGKKK